MAGDSNQAGGETRRSFLKKTAAMAVTAGLLPVYGRDERHAVWIVSDPDDVVVKEAPVQWAVEQLREALEARGVAAQIRPGRKEAPSGGECIVVASRASSLAREVMKKTADAGTDGPEALGLGRGKAGGRTVL